MAYCVAGNYTIQNCLGVGTETPSVKLHVFGSAVTPSGGYSVNDIVIEESGEAALGIIGTTYSSIYFGDAGTALAGAIVYDHSNDNLGFRTIDNSERMRITSVGNVGINVTNPSTKLHVCNPVNQAYTPTAFNSDLHALHIQFCNQNQRAGLIRFTSHGNLENTFGVVQVGCAAAGCGQGDFVFQAYREAGGAAYSELMRLTNTGNVGISCSTPTNTLEVNGTGRFRDTLSIGVSASSTSRFQLNFLNWNPTNSYPYITFQNPTANCRHGIGINTSDDFVIGRTTGINCNFIHQDFVIVNSTGNTGINTSSPSYKLHVNGTFYAAGSSQDYKTSVCQYDTDSCMFMKLKPVTYQYKDEYKHLGKELKSETQIGLIAEEVAEVMPELAVLINEEDNKVVRNVDYEKLSIVLLNEVQKLRREMDSLNK